MHAERRPRLVWISTASPTESLDAATWLETTRELRSLGWDVTLYAVGPESVRKVLGTVVTCVPTEDAYFLRKWVFHTRILRQLWSSLDSVDIILFHQMSAPWVLALKPLRGILGKGCPLLAMDTRTVAMVPADWATWKTRIRKAFYWLMNWAANRWADGQTAITEGMAKKVGIPDTRLWGVWPSGANVERFEAANNHRQWPNSEARVRLVYTGVLAPGRNLLEMSQAVMAARNEGMEFELTLIGGGPDQSRLEMFAANSGGGVRIVSRVPHSTIPTYLANAHVGVLPFPDEERFQVSSPIKLFEYMAAGLPILATRIACHTNVVKDGMFAFWAQSSDVPDLRAALENIWRERARLDVLGGLAAEAAREWSWEAAAKKLSAALAVGLVRTGTEWEFSDIRNLRGVPGDAAMS